MLSYAERNIVFRYMCDWYTSVLFSFPYLIMNDPLTSSGIKQPFPPANPPRFLADQHMEAQETTRLDARLAVFKEHWTNIQDLLDDGAGYMNLTMFKDRLLDRRRELEPELECASDRAAYLKLLIQEYLEEATRPHDQSDGNVEGLIDSGTLDELVDRPIAEQFTGVADGKVVPDANIPKDWAVTSKRREANDTNVRRMTVIYRPTEESLSAASIDSSSLRPQDNFTFSGDTTWKEAISKLREHRVDLEIQRERCARIDERLRFRMAVADIALYRFEVLGDTQLPNRDTVLSILGLELPSNVFDGHPKLRRHAEHIVQQYKDDPRGLPSKTRDFYAWLGSWKDESGDTTMGESADKSLKRLLREHNLAPGSEAGYEQGNPESFCDLLERLLLVDASD